jgi:hypothetical protein
MVSILKKCSLFKRRHSLKENQQKLLQEKEPCCRRLDGLMGDQYGVVAGPHYHHYWA